MIVDHCRTLATTLQHLFGDPALNIVKSLTTCLILRTPGSPVFVSGCMSQANDARSLPDGRRCSQAQVFQFVSFRAVRMKTSPVRLLGESPVICGKTPTLSPGYGVVLSEPTEPI